MIAPFRIVMMFSISMQSLGRSNQTLYERKLVLFVCHAWSACTWGHSSNKYCV